MQTSSFWLELQFSPFHSFSHMPKLRDVHNCMHSAFAASAASCNYVKCAEQISKLFAIIYGNVVLRYDPIMSPPSTWLRWCRGFRASVALRLAYNIFARRLIASQRAALSCGKYTIYARTPDTPFRPPTIWFLYSFWWLFQCRIKVLLDILY